MELPAYFHQRDAGDDRVNKGVGQLNLEVDFVIAPTLSPAQVQAFPSLAEVPLEPPLLETGELPTGTTLYVRAVKAQTGIETPLEQTVQPNPDPT